MSSTSPLGIDRLAQLHALHLYGMATAWSELLAEGPRRPMQPEAWMDRLIEAELADRQVRSLRYQLKAARFPVHRDLTGIDWAERAAATLAHHHDGAALAGLVFGQPPIDPVGRQVLRPDMATEIGAIDLGHPSFAADPQPPHASCHSLAQLMRQHERGLVLNVQITGERQHAFALHFIAEHRDGEQVTPQRQLVPGEQRSGRERKVVAARFAAPARLAPHSTTGVTGRAATVRTDRLAVGLRPTQPEEHILHAKVRHPHHLGEAERTCGGG